MADKQTFSDSRLQKWLDSQNIDTLAHASSGTKNELSDRFIQSEGIEEITKEDKDALQATLLHKRNEMVGIENA